MMPRSVYLPLLHMSFSPALHWGQTPHGRRTVATTRSPAFQPLTFLPTSSTTPRFSWPRIRNSSPSGALPYRPWLISASVPQRPTRSIFTATWSGFIFGSGVSRMWIESFSPGFTTIAFMRSSLEIRQRIRGRNRMALFPVVVLVTFEAAAFGLPPRVARRADSLVRQQHVRSLRAGLRADVAARARHHEMRRVIEHRSRHPPRRDVGR